MKKALFALAVIMMLFITTCEPIPKGSVVITLEEYTQLKDGAIIKEVVKLVPPNYDSVNSFWQGKLTSEKFAYETEIDKLNNLLLNKDTIIVVDTIEVATEFVQPTFVKITPSDVVVDSVGNKTVTNTIAENMVDGVPFISKNNSGTRWAVPGYPHYAMFYFGEPVFIDSIEINTYGWDSEYTHSITVYTWGDSITTFQTKPEMYSGHKLGVVSSNVLLKINNGKNNWCDIGEVVFYGKKLGGTQ